MAGPATEARFSVLQHEGTLYVLAKSFPELDLEFLRSVKSAVRPINDTLTSIPFADAFLSVLYFHHKEPSRKKPSKVLELLLRADTCLDNHFPMLGAVLDHEHVTAYTNSNWTAARTDDTRAWIKEQDKAKDHTGVVKLGHSTVKLIDISITGITVPLLHEFQTEEDHYLSPCDPPELRRRVLLRARGSESDDFHTAVADLKRPNVKGLGWCCPVRGCSVIKSGIEKSGKFRGPDFIRAHVRQAHPEVAHKDIVFRACLARGESVGFVATHPELWRMCGDGGRFPITHEHTLQADYTEAGPQDADGLPPGRQRGSSKKRARTRSMPAEDMPSSAPTNPASGAGVAPSATNPAQPGDTTDLSFLCSPQMKDIIASTNAAGNSVRWTHSAPAVTTTAAVITLEFLPKTSHA